MKGWKVAETHQNAKILVWKLETETIMLLDSKKHKNENGFCDFKNGSKVTEPQLSIVGTLCIACP